jgi:hypothetical protein
MRDATVLPMTEPVAPNEKHPKNWSCPNGCTDPRDHAGRYPRCAVHPPLPSKHVDEITGRCLDGCESVERVMRRANPRLHLDLANSAMTTCYYCSETVCASCQQVPVDIDLSFCERCDEAAGYDLIDSMDVSGWPITRDRHLTWSAYGFENGCRRHGRSGELPGRPFSKVVLKSYSRNMGRLPTFENKGLSVAGGILLLPQFGADRPAVIWPVRAPHRRKEDRNGEHP